MNPEYYAHSLPGKPLAEWQPLEAHLDNVAKLAECFARSFGGGPWARIEGRHHDLGKGTSAWQAYLRHANSIKDAFAAHYVGRIEHAAIGAQILYERSAEAGKLLAYCIAGHHGGLSNWHDSAESALSAKLKKQWPAIYLSFIDPEMPKQLPIAVPDYKRFGFQVQFFVRMLFSCLVDADYLDTEAALDPQKAPWRAQYPPLTDMHPIFWRHFNALRDNAVDTAVKRQRELVLSDCLAAAQAPAGLFSLTVPTGGGKTLASLAFALDHARKHHKRRIIYVIPFTSIIEQNAAVFRAMVGESNILEHHCQFTADDADWTMRLAAENWDAPIVVTTNVQFFDSFFARKPSRCRKLHNVADSIVIFDEVQAIPVEKLMPCLEVVRELTLNYKVTALLCTATQPAIHFSETFEAGLKDVREIIQDVPVLFKSLKRTHEAFIGTLAVGDLAAKLMVHPQVLCVVNTRQQALDLFNTLPYAEDHFHLSALMHPAHRSRVLATIRDRLDRGLTCRTVSTQLIEAGVDVDFECVYRVIGGIDSIAQAAGRCNRNGRSPTLCPVYVFSFPDSSENAYFRMSAQSAKKLFARFEGDLTAPECVHAYFEDYFWKNTHRMDSDGIVKMCHTHTACKGEFQFKDIAAFQMIQTATRPVVIAIEPEAVALVAQLPFAGHSRAIRRKLQRYTVQVYTHQLTELHTWLENPCPDLWVLRSEELYSELTGLKCAPPQGCAFFG